MSLAITVYVPTGIVMASDSRQFITMERTKSDGTPLPTVQTVSSDFVYKTFSLKNQKVGISTYGENILGKVTIESYIKRFTEEEVEENDDVTTVSRKLLDSLRKRFPKADTAFHIAGFKKDGKVNVPHVYLCHVGKNELARKNVKERTGEVIYGATWGGEIDVISSILQPVTTRKGVQVYKPPIVWDTMTIQDAIDFAIYAVRTTIDTMRFQARPKTVGGAIDVLLLTPDDDPKWIQRKEYKGELQ